MSTDNMQDSIWTIIQREKLAIQLGTSPYKEGEPPHTYYAFVAKNYHDLHHTAKIGRHYVRVGATESFDTTAALEQAYSEFRKISYTPSKMDFDGPETG